MGSIALVTDSTAYLPSEVVGQYGITVVPLYVNFGDESYRDNVDITPDDFYARLATTRVMPTTSQPSRGDFTAIYRRLVNQGATAIISAHISSLLSGTVSSATMARDDVPEVPIYVVDSLSTSMGLGYVVLEAARQAEAGRPAEEVVRSLERLRERVRVVFVVDTLEFLHRGGRIGGAAAFLGSMLSLKPLLALRDGRIEAVERVRTKRRAVSRMLELVKGEMGDRPIRAAVLHAAALEEGKAFLEEVRGSLVCRESYLTPVSPVIGTHAGPGTVGLVACPIVEE
jgi:DegV family protein with EDD domain